MKTEIQYVDYTNVKNVLDEIKNAYYDIPFGNTAFQTEAFVIAAEITPERAYRAIGLKMLSSIKTLEEANLGMKRVQIDLDEIEHNLKSNDLNQFDKRREELKKESLLIADSWQSKLVNDTIEELNILYKHFKSFPRYTRDQFESAERLHFEQRLTRQAIGLDGAKSSMINMNEDLSALLNFEKEVEKLEFQNLNSETLTLLTVNMTNILKEKINDVQSN